MKQKPLDDLDSFSGFYLLERNHMHKEYLLLAWEIVKLFGILAILYKLLKCF